MWFDGFWLKGLKVFYNNPQTFKPQNLETSKREFRPTERFTLNTQLNGKIDKKAQSR